jgi:hypothetical protein
MESFNDQIQAGRTLDYPVLVHNVKLDQTYQVNIGFYNKTRLFTAIAQIIKVDAALRHNDIHSNVVQEISPGKRYVLNTKLCPSCQVKWTNCCFYFQLYPIEKNQLSIHKESQ